jgi:hypothetical protein
MASGEKDDGDKLPFSISFGLLIAYFLPGSITVFALGYLVPDVSAALSTLKEGDKVAGVSIILAVMCLVSGLIIDSIREVALNGFFYGCVGIEHNSPQIEKLKNKEKYEAFLGVIDNYYRFYQFSGNTFIAAIFLVITRYAFGGASYFSTTADGALTVLSFLVSYFLAHSAFNYLRATSRSIKKLNETDD